VLQNYNTTISCAACGGAISSSPWSLDLLHLVPAAGRPPAGGWGTPK